MSASAMSYKDWIVPLHEETMTLRQGKLSLAPVALDQREVPLIVQLVENPRFDLPGFDLFHGATDLVTHDYIHMILGRGLLAKDEAFVLGFTMGSTDRVGTFEERLYTFVAKHFYPKGYAFADEEIALYRDAVRLGHISDVKALSEIDFAPLLDLPLQQVRAAIGLEVDLLRAFYAIERRRYPHSPESQRLLDALSA
jgi:hypothetical protein